MELSGPKIKKVLKFSQKNVFYIFWEMELSSPKIKKLLEGASGAWKIKKNHSEKISYISGNGTF